jgi:hypothetical protein
MTYLPADAYVTQQLQPLAKLIDFEDFNLVGGCSVRAGGYEDMADSDQLRDSGQSGRSACGVLCMHCDMPEP